jgi:hypothetical protein
LLTATLEPVIADGSYLIIAANSTATCAASAALFLISAMLARRLCPPGPCVDAGQQTLGSLMPQ